MKLDAFGSIIAAESSDTKSAGVATENNSNVGEDKPDGFEDNFTTLDATDAVIVDKSASHLSLESGSNFLIIGENGKPIKNPQSFKPDELNNVIKHWVPIYTQSNILP